MHRRRRERTPYRLSWKKPGSTSTSSNCVSIGIAYRRASNIIVWTATIRRRNILMKSSASICTPSPNCGATLTRWLLYSGPHPKRRGARRKYDGKVNFQALHRFEALGTRLEEPHVHLCIPLWCGPRRFSGACVLWFSSIGKTQPKPRFIVLGSTDPELNGPKLIDLYIARFQIEFLFRDSKQFTGLLDCQARTAAASLDFHCNASLATLNLVRFRGLCMQQGNGPLRLLDDKLETGVNSTSDCSIYL